MATQNHTVTNHSCVFNVVDLMIVKNAVKEKQQHNAHYAEAIVLPTKTFANIIVP